MSIRLVRRGLGLLTLLTVFGFGLPATAAEEAIGYVKAASGFVQVVRGGRAYPIEAGAAVYRQDELITGRTGKIGVTFRDGSRVSLGPTSHLSLKSFEFEPAEEKLGFFARLVHGSVHIITGVISKLAPDAFSVETPVATIAVRGTNFAIRAPGGPTR